MWPSGAACRSISSWNVEASLLRSGIGMRSPIRTGCTHHSGPQPLTGATPARQRPGGLPRAINPARVVAWRGLGLGPEGAKLGSGSGLVGCRRVPSITASVALSTAAAAPRHRRRNTTMAGNRVLGGAGGRSRWSQLTIRRSCRRRVAGAIRRRFEVGTEAAHRKINWRHSPERTGHLRLGLSRGQVCWCDSSPPRHARAYAGWTGHSMMRCFDSLDSRRLCYLDEPHV